MDVRNKYKLHKKDLKKNTPEVKKQQEDDLAKLKQNF